MIQKKTLFRAPRQEPPRGMAEETVLAVLLYDGDGAALLSPEELAEDTGKLQNAGLAVVLKCLFSQGRISS